jgi:hypothetical protein
VVVLAVVGAVAAGAGSRRLHSFAVFQYRRWVRALYHYGAPRSAERVSVSALSGATMSGRGCHRDLDWLHRRFWKGLGHLLLYFMVKIRATIGCVYISKCGRLKSWMPFQSSVSGPLPFMLVKHGS